jgi:hypothetical protein
MQARAPVKNMDTSALNPDGRNLIENVNVQGTRLFASLRQVLLSGFGTYKRLAHTTLS